jgi:hypothetical protein
MLAGRYHLVDLGTDGRIMLKEISTIVGLEGVDTIRLTEDGGPLAGCWDHSSKLEIS